MTGKGYLLLNKLAHFPKKYNSGKFARKCITRPHIKLQQSFRIIKYSNTSANGA
jgi:hypothetical protein